MGSTWFGRLSFKLPPGPSSVTIDASTNAPNALAGSVTHKFEVSGAVDSPPFVNPGGVVNAASFQTPPLAPGSIISVYGAGLSANILNPMDLLLGGGQQAQSLPVPKTLGGARLYFSVGANAPVVFSRSDQLNAITPYALAEHIGETVQMIAVRDNVQSVGVAPMLIAESQPAVFLPGGAPAAVHFKPGTEKHGKTVSETYPAAAGDVILLFLNGLGQVKKTIEDADVRFIANEPTVVRIGGVAANVLFSGLAYEFAGLNQVNLIIPPGLSPGNLPLKVILGGIESPDGVTIRIQ